MDELEERELLVIRRKVVTLSRLWHDFPEIWGICSRWEISESAPIPVVKTFTRKELRRKWAKGDQWWVVSSKEVDGKLYRRLTEINNWDITLYETLSSALQLNKIDSTSWDIKYMVLKEGTSFYPQKITIYKPPTDQSINEVCLNTKTR